MKLKKSFKWHSVCGRIVTHTHTKPDGSNHTFISDWDFDEYNHQFTHNQ